MKSVRLALIFRPNKETNRTHSKGYVEDRERSAGENMYQDDVTACIRASYAPIQKEEMI